MQKLAINEKYPFGVDEGLKANFMSSSGNVLQIGLHGISSEEIHAFRKGDIKCGLIIDQPLLLFLFDFGAGGQYDAPFDVRLYNKGKLALHDITSDEQRLAIEMHVIELKDQTVKALRLFTLPHDLTVKFLSAAQDQLVQPYDKTNQKLYFEKLNGYYQYPIEQLISKTKMHLGGS